jgi:ketosteroid isomerase-like protein
LFAAPGWLWAAPSPSPTPLKTDSDLAQRENAAAPDSAELIKLLRDFLAGASRNDAAMHDRFWADDLIYTSSSGRRLGKAEILREVKKEGPSKAGEEETVFSAEDIRVHQYGETAIVAFRLVGTTRKNGKTEIANYLNTGTFLKRNGEWRAVGWQATILPPPGKTEK